MDLQSKIGQLFFIGIEGTEESEALRRHLQDLRPGGVILFARNIAEARQVRRLCSFLSRAVDPPPFLSIDQEGGRVNRLSGLVGALPPAASLARREGGAGVGAFARRTAQALRSLGFNMDFAPVVDLSSPGAPSGIGDRSFGEEPDTVVRLAGAFVEGLQRAGVAAVLKHFPGLGPTALDTHVSLPTSTKPFERLWQEDLLPFRRLGDRAAAIMIAHAHYACLDPDGPVPASLSVPAVGELLRRRMGYAGLAITDDLEMGAVCAERPGDELGTDAVLAGSDMVMFCSSAGRIEEARRGLVRAFETARLSKERLEQSLARIASVKERLGPMTTAPGLPAQEFEEARGALLRMAEAHTA